VLPIDWLVSTKKYFLKIYHLNLYFQIAFKIKKEPKTKNHTTIVQNIRNQMHQKHISHKTHPSCIIYKRDQQKLYHSSVNITTKTGKKPKGINCITLHELVIHVLCLLCEVVMVRWMVLIEVAVVSHLQFPKSCASEPRIFRDSSLLSWSLVGLVYIFNNTRNCSPPYPHP